MSKFTSIPAGSDCLRADGTVQVEKEKAAAEPPEPLPAIAFPRFAVWLIGIGMFLVIAGWLVSFPVNELVKKWAGSTGLRKHGNRGGQVAFFPGTVLVAISLLVFGYQGRGSHPAGRLVQHGRNHCHRGRHFSVLRSAAVGCIEKSIHSWPNPVPEVVLVNGLLNPFFFVGVPLGIYWLTRGKQTPVPRASKRK